MAKDLGNYHVEVITSHGGFIYRWDTGGRFTLKGADGINSLDAFWSPPGWEDEADLVRAIIFMFTEGNYSCDCNLGSFLDRARDIEVDHKCGDEIKLVSLTLIKPDATREVIWHAEETLAIGL